MNARQRRISPFGYILSKGVRHPFAAYVLQSNKQRCLSLMGDVLSYRIHTDRLEVNQMTNLIESLIIDIAALATIVGTVLDIINFILERRRRRKRKKAGKTDL